MPRRPIPTLHLTVLASSIVLSIATSPPPPAFLLTETVELDPITLTESAPDTAFELVVEKDPALDASSSWMYSYLTLDVTNTAHASTELQLWGLTEAWDGETLPEDAWMVSSAVVRGAIAEAPETDRVYLDIWTETDGGYFLLTATSDEEHGLALSLTGELSVTIESNEEQPEGTGFTVEVIR